MYRAAITADWHLGNYSHGTFDKELGVNSVCADIIRSARKILAHCVQNKIRRIVHLGDVFDVPNPASLYKRLFAEFLYRCRLVGITVDLLKGNHDQGPNAFAFEDLKSLHIDNLNVIDESKIEIIEESKVAIVWFPHQRRIDKKEITWRKCLTQFIEENQSKLDELRQAGFFILFYGHFPLFGASIEASDHKLDCEDNIAPEQLSSNFDASILGDIHKAQDIGSNIWYVGTPERLDFGSRDEEKRFLVIDDRTLAKVPLQCRKLIQIECEYDQAELEIEKRAAALEGATVKLVIHCSLDQYRNTLFFNDLAEKIKKYNVHHLIKISRQIKIDRQERIIQGVSQKSTIRDSAQAYIKHFHASYSGLNALLELNSQLHEEIAMDENEDG